MCIKYGSRGEAGRGFKPAQKQKDTSPGIWLWPTLAMAAIIIIIIMVVSSRSSSSSSSGSRRIIQQRDQQTADDYEDDDNDDDWQSFPNLISSYSRVCVELTNETKAPPTEWGRKHGGQTSIAQQSRRRSWSSFTSHAPHLIWGGWLSNRRDGHGVRLSGFLYQGLRSEDCGARSED